MKPAELNIYNIFKIKLPFFLILVLVMPVFFSCGGDGAGKKPDRQITFHYTEKDTAEVLKIVLENAYSRNLLDNEIPELSRPFGDSVIIEYNPLLDSNMPAPDNLKLKVLDRDAICRLMSRLTAGSSSLPLLQVLRIHQFKNTNNGYEIRLANAVAVPTFDSKGKPVKSPSGKIYRGKEKCEITFGLNSSSYNVRKIDNRFIVTLKEVLKK
jgi:hypothetical protein